MELRGFATRAEESAAIAEMIAADSRTASRTGGSPCWCAREPMRGKSPPGCGRGASPFARWKSNRCRIVSIVRDIIMLVCALLHFGDRTAWLAVLRAPWAGRLPGRSAADLARRAVGVGRAGATRPSCAQLSEDGQVRCRRLRSALEAAFRVRNDSSRRALGGKDLAGSRRRQLRRVAAGSRTGGAAFARLRELEQRGLPDAADLPGSFADLYADHGAASAVEIMTIHKAKGLEFDMVVLPALDRARSGQPQSIVGGASVRAHRTRRHGDGGASRGRRGPTIDYSSSCGISCAMRPRLEARAPAVRGLHPGKVAAAPDRDRRRRASRPRMLDDGRCARPWSPRREVCWPFSGRWRRAEFAVAEPRPPGPDAGAPRGGPSGARAAGLGAQRRMPGRRRRRRSSAPPALRDETPVFDWAGETARRVGTLVHAELQTMNLGGRRPRARSARVNRIFGAGWRLHGVPADRLQEAAARVVEALIAVQRGSARPMDSAAGARGRSANMRSRAGCTGEVARVVFDRSFVDDRRGALGHRLQDQPARRRRPRGIPGSRGRALPAAVAALCLAGAETRAATRPSGAVLSLDASLARMGGLAAGCRLRRG